MSDMTILYTIYLLIGSLLFISILLSTLSARIGFPFLLIFLFIGMLAGEDGIGGIVFNNFFNATLICQLSLAVILLDGGLKTNTKTFRVSLKPAIILASWGVIATVFCLGIAIFLLFEFDWKMSLLMAAIVGSTDAAAVFNLLRNSGIRLKEKIQATLEIESGANDPIAILLVTVLINLILMPDESSWFGILIMFFQQLGFGFLLGILGGSLLSLLLVRVTLPEGLYALLITSGGLLIFALTNLIGGSGFLAIFLAGIIIGQLKRHTTQHVLRMTDGLTWLAQACMFLILGLLVKPERLLDHLTYSIVISFILMFIARPFAVWSSLKIFHYPKNEILFISWVGLRGAVPVTLAIMPVMMNVPGSQILFDISFTIVLISLIVQGISIPPMAKLYKVELPPKYEPNDTQSIWVSEKSVVDLHEFIVNQDSEARGQKPDRISQSIIHNQDNDKDIRFFALVRSDQLINLTEETVLEPEDSVWYITTPNYIENLAKFFSDTKNEMNLNLNYFGEFNIDPQVSMKELSTMYDIPLDSINEDLSAAQYVKKILNFPPSSGDRVTIGDYQLTIKKTKGNHITELYLKIPKMPVQ